MSDHTPVQQKTSLLGFLLLIPPPLFWAGNFIVGRAMRGDVPPLTLGFWRWVIAFLFILPFALPHMRRQWPLYWQYRWHLLRVTIAGVVSFNSLIYVGLQWTPASNGLLLNSFIPILIMLFGALFYNQGLQKRQVIGLLMSFSGVLTIIMHGDWSRLAALDFSYGDLIVFCAMVSWAFYTLWLRVIPPEINRIGLMAAQIGLAFVFITPLYFFELATGRFAVWNTESFMALAYLGVFPSVLAYLLYNIGVMKVGAARAGLFIHLIPVFGVALAVLFLGEIVQTYHIIGVSAIFLGIGMATLVRKKPEKLPV